MGGSRFPFGGGGGGGFAIGGDGLWSVDGGMGDGGLVQSFKERGESSASWQPGDEAVFQSGGLRIEGPDSKDSHSTVQYVV